MKTCFALAAAALVLTGCTSIYAQEDVRNKIAATCMSEPNEAARKKCADTEMAAMSALRRDQMRERQAAEQARENREALREAYGAPRDQARVPYDNGLRIP